MLLVLLSQCRHNTQSVFNNSFNLFFLFTPMLTGCLLVIYKYIDTPANGLTILRFLTWHLFNPAEIRFSKHFLWCHSKPTRNTMSYYDDDYECRFCTRYFGSQRALNSHCRSKHVWCERCYRAFSTVSAKKGAFSTIQCPQCVWIVHPKPRLLVWTPA